MQSRFHRAPACARMGTSLTECLHVHAGDLQSMGGLKDMAVFSNAAPIVYTPDAVAVGPLHIHENHLAQLFTQPAAHEQHLLPKPCGHAASKHAACMGRQRGAELSAACALSLGAGAVSQQQRQRDPHARGDRAAHLRPLLQRLYWAAAAVAGHRRGQLHRGRHPHPHGAPSWLLLPRPEYVLPGCSLHVQHVCFPSRVPGVFQV